ncbi:MAG TPA: trigger factor, partial [Candidatus Dormibacteraeota bacterium]|nr:trigger factor [Candidatus Dormibacteraeota bacterium]
VRVPGFRPGKAPRPVLEREIGWPLLRQEAIDLLLPEALGEAVTEHALEAIDTPHVEIDVFERLQPARFRATVQVKPEVRLPDVRAIRAPLQPVAVTSEQVDASLEALRQSFAVLAPADNRPVEAGDHLIVDLQVLRDGQPVDEQPAADIELNADPESLIPGLFEGVAGMVQGETREIPLKLPDDYRRTELAGQEVVFRVTVKEIKEQVLPEVDDELARQVLGSQPSLLGGVEAGGGETLAELRQRLEERLRAAAERDAVFKQQKEALDRLISESAFEVPEAMVEQEIDRELRNLAAELEGQGIDFEKFVQYGGANLEDLRRERRAGAHERVRQELVLDALATAQGLDPSAEHVHAEAHHQLAGAEDAERLVHSERVQAYVKERLRLQWALLWLSATAQGREWAPPAPDQPHADDAPASAAGEILEQPPVAVPDAPGAPSLPIAAGVASDPGGEPGMVDL